MLVETQMPVYSPKCWLKPKCGFTPDQNIGRNSFVFHFFLFFTFVTEYIVKMHKIMILIINHLAKHLLAGQNKQHTSNVTKPCCNKCP